WVYARKVVTHEKYSFYNPKHHSEFDKEGGRVIFFEGTYTASFSGNTDPTPRYDYNQVMYKLDLSDPRLRLPVAVYPTPNGGHVTGADGFRAAGGAAPAFFAWERSGPGSVAIPNKNEPRFHALGLDAADPPGATILLYQSPDGRLSTTETPGWRAVGRVWPA